MAGVKKKEEVQGTGANFENCKNREMREVETCRRTYFSIRDEYEGVQYTVGEVVSRWMQALQSGRKNVEIVEQADLPIMPVKVWSSDWLRDTMRILAFLGLSAPYHPNALEISILRDLEMPADVDPSHLILKTPCRWAFCM